MQLLHGASCLDDAEGNRSYKIGTCRSQWRLMREVPITFIPTPHQVDALLHFRPLLDPASEACQTHLGEFLETAYANDFVLDFDWSAWITEHKRYEDLEGVSSAPLEDVVRLFTVHLRQDRFCGGHLSWALSSGYLFALLNRLQQLRKEGVC